MLNRWRHKGKVGDQARDLKACDQGAMKIFVKGLFTQFIGVLYKVTLKQKHITKTFIKQSQK